MDLRDHNIINVNKLICSTSIFTTHTICGLGLQCTIHHTYRQKGKERKRATSKLNSKVLEGSDLRPFPFVYETELLVKQEHHYDAGIIQEVTRNKKPPPPIR